MQSRFEQRLTVNRNDAYYGSSTAVGVLQNETLNVRNGDQLIQGDHKSPNRFYWTKSIDGFVIGRRVILSNGPWYQPNRYEIFSGSLEGRPTTFYLSPDFDSCLDDCWGRIYDQLRGNNQILIDLAEAHQTRKMLKNTTKLRELFGNFWGKETATKKYRDFRRIKHGPTKSQQQLDYLTGKWLEYRYGWTPLVNSIYDAADQIAKREFKRNILVKARRGRLTSVNRLNPFGGSGAYGSPIYGHAETLEFRSDVKCEFCLPVNQVGIQIYDWTTLNPALIAWELVPLSFVADWVVNVSQVLSSIENFWLFAAAFKRGYRTNTFQRVVRHTMSQSTIVPRAYNSDGTPVDGQVYHRTSSGRGYSVDSYHDRLPLTGLPIAASPRFEVNLGAKRQLDAAALLHQLVGKKMRLVQRLI